MERSGFWDLIERSRAESNECNKQIAVLKGLLQQVLPSEILAFEACLSELMQESYRGDLWTVAYIVNRGCSSDGFAYFRGWLILQGKEVFEGALASPVKIAEYAQPGSLLSCEEVFGVARVAYERATGNSDMPYDGPRGPGELKGKILTEVEMRQRYPALWKRFVEDVD
jgi:hypothetical protein